MYYNRLYNLKGGIMLYLFYIIILTELITIFYNIIKFYIYKIKSHHISNKTNYQCDENLNINILIPCYKEINVIYETLKHFKKIIAQIPNIDIYISHNNKKSHIFLDFYHYLFTFYFHKLSIKSNYDKQKKIF